MDEFREPSQPWRRQAHSAEASQAGRLGLTLPFGRFFRMTDGQRTAKAALRLIRKPDRLRRDPRMRVADAH